MSEISLANPIGNIGLGLIASSFGDLTERIDMRAATAWIIGLGYVGLPLAMACARAGFKALGLDVDPDKVATLRRH